MSLSTLIFTVAIILFVAILIIFPKARVLIKGFIGVFIEDRAKTPEGARAVYEEAINEAQDEYAKANDILQKFTGKLDSAKKELVTTQKKISEIEKKCETFAKNNQWEEVQLYAEQKDILESDLESLATLISELELNVEEATEINREKEIKLTTLKREKEKIVNDLIRDRQLKEIYDDMDELKSRNTTGKLVQSVREGAKDARENAVGARAVHNSKTSTKIARADARAAQLSSNDYVESLKKKYGNTSQK